MTSKLVLSAAAVALATAYAAQAEAAVVTVSFVGEVGSVGPSYPFPLAPGAKAKISLSYEGNAAPGGNFGGSVPFQPVGSAAIEVGGETRNYSNIYFEVRRIGERRELFFNSFDTPIQFVGVQGTIHGFDTGGFVLPGTAEEFYAAYRQSDFLASIFGDYSNSVQGKLLPLAAGVPEPASWAMMIAGFGLAGFAARRRTPQDFRLMRQH